VKFCPVSLNVKPSKAYHLLSKDLFGMILENFMSKPASTKLAKHEKDIKLCVNIEMKAKSGHVLAICKTVTPMGKILCLRRQLVMISLTVYLIASL
jgi:hypothetical protein